MLLQDIKNIKNGRIISGQKELVLDSKTNDDWRKGYDIITKRLAGIDQYYWFAYANKGEHQLQARGVTEEEALNKIKEQVKKYGKDSKTKDADYKNYFDVGRDVGLSGQTLTDYVNYMRERWPNKENSPAELGGYCKEWARRFAKGDAWRLSDLSGQRILKRMGITDSKSTKDANDIWAVVFENTVMATYPTESQARNFINRLHGTREDKQGYYVKQVDPKIKQGDRVRDSKTKDGWGIIAGHKGWKILREYSRLTGNPTGKYMAAPEGFQTGIEFDKIQGNSIEEVKRKIDNIISTKDQIAELEEQKEEAKKKGYGTDAYDAKIKNLQKDAGISREKYNQMKRDAENDLVEATRKNDTAGIKEAKDLLEDIEKDWEESVAANKDSADESDVFTQDPLTEKGKEILAAMKKQYGEEKGEQVFYASKNKGTISGVDSYDPTQPKNIAAAKKLSVAQGKAATGDAPAPKEFDYLKDWQNAAMERGYRLQNSLQRGMWIAYQGNREMGTFVRTRGGKLYLDSKTKDDLEEEIKKMAREKADRPFNDDGTIRTPQQAQLAYEQWYKIIKSRYKNDSRYKDSDIIINVVENPNEEVESEEEAFDLVHYNGYNIKLVKETGEYDIYDVGGAMIGHTATLELAKLFVDNKGNATIVYE